MFLHFREINVMEEYAFYVLFKNSIHFGYLIHFKVGQKFIWNEIQNKKV